MTSEHRKCTFTLYFKVVDWKHDISVRVLTEGLREYLGFLQIQTTDSFWSEFRIRSLENKLTRERILTVPLFEVLLLGGIFRVTKRLFVIF